MNQILKKATNTFFGEGCKTCSMRTYCLSPTAVLGDDRRFLFKLKGVRQKANAIMIKGKENHEIRQAGIPDMTEYHPVRFKRNLKNGQEIELSEVGICSPKFGFRGFIDIFKIKYDKESKKVWVDLTELKSGHNFKSYLMQLACYGMILSDPNCLVYWRKPYVRKKGDRHMPFKLYPVRSKVLYVDFTIEVFGQDEPSFFKYIHENKVVHKMENLTMGFRSKANHKRRFMDGGLYFLENTPKCKWCKECSDNCDLWDRYCHKIVYTPLVKESQHFFGTNRLLRKSKYAKVM